MQFLWAEHIELQVKESEFLEERRTKAAFSKFISEILLVRTWETKQQLSFLFSNTLKEKGGFTGKLSEHKAEVFLGCLRDSCGSNINRNTAQNRKLSTN